MTKPDIEAFIVRNLTIFSALGFGLRFMIYGIPSIEMIWLYVLLSVMVGVGGSLLALGREFQRTKFSVLGVVFAFLGLLPFHYLF
ncbi:MAG: hypothetical protein ACFFEF_02565 [Candidatus Thorarchaeota archaeon]